MAKERQHLQWDVAGYLPQGHAISQAIASVTITASGVGSMSRQHVVAADQGEKHSSQLQSAWMSIDGSPRADPQPITRAA
ncbi:hypothetical protein MMC22_011801 [Lobaria immixta]|nr:hypothetical protein [Lobaria immixta]